MKKLLGLIAVVAAMLLVTACGGGNSPKGVAKQAMEAMKNKDADKLVELFYVKDSDGKSVENEKQMLVAMFQEKMDKQDDTKDGIKSYEIVSEEMGNDGTTATVTVKIVYADGRTDNDVMKMKKNDKGEWKIDMSK